MREYIGRRFGELLQIIRCFLYLQTAHAGDIMNLLEKYERMWGVNDIREENKHEEETVEQCR